MQPKVTIWHRMNEDPSKLEQHKPSQRTRLITDDEGSSYSFGQTEEVIIQQPGEAFQSLEDSNNSFGLSLILRGVSLGFSSFLAWFFLSHYQLPNGGGIVFGTSGKIFLMFAFVYAISVIVKRATKDREVPVAILQSGIGKVFWRPIFSYLGWTFLFFVMPFLGHSPYTLAIATSFIGLKGLSLRLNRDRGFGPMSFNQSGFKFSSIKFRR